MKTCCQHQTATLAPVPKTKVTQGLCPGMTLGVRRVVSDHCGKCFSVAPCSSEHSVLIVGLLSANRKAATQGGGPMDRLDRPRSRPSCDPSRVGWLTSLGSWVFERSRSHPRGQSEEGQTCPMMPFLVCINCAPVLK